MPIVALALALLLAACGAAPVTPANVPPVATTRAVAPAPASGRAAPQGRDCPASHPIKGNASSMIYHVPGGAFYTRTTPEDCFATAADAVAAGYRSSQR